MLLSVENLNKLRVGFSAAFKRGLSNRAARTSSRIATRVPSTVMEQTYGWLGKLPNVREWVGARVVQNLSEGSYSIKEKPWELTIGVNRDHIETDNIGQYSLLFEEMGDSTGGFEDQLAWSLLKLGFSTVCYDGQFFFDTDHPVLDENGVVQSVANTDGGAGTPWFLIDISRVIKPVIIQSRRGFGDIVARDKLTDDNVFDLNEFRYGVDARLNVGFSFWQFAWGSKQDLTAGNFELALTSLQSMKGDYGRPLGSGGQYLLVVPPTLQKKAKTIVVSKTINNGEDNPWVDAAELMVEPWLA